MARQADYIAISTRQQAPTPCYIWGELSLLILIRLNTQASLFQWPVISTLTVVIQLHYILGRRWLPRGRGEVGGRLAILFHPLTTVGRIGLPGFHVKHIMGRHDLLQMVFYLALLSQIYEVVPKGGIFRIVKPK